MRYWWVNHKQTSRHEISGGFLWSPMFKVDGSRNHFYETMRMAAPGDIVISYSHATIKFVGVVLDFAIASPKPPVFGSIGENWNRKNGWLLKVNWRSLSEPVMPKQKLEEIRAFLPEKYSPIRSVTGDGNQGAYFAEISENIFKVLIGGPSSFLETDKFFDLTESSVLSDIDDEIEQEILSDSNLDITTKERLIASRVGQGVFKSRIFDFEYSCRLTKVTAPRFLIASHIKPWRLCGSAYERLDGANGLLLTPNVDFLFDRGYISFSDFGDVLFSKEISLIDLKKMGIDPSTASKGEEFHDRQKIYLKFHREKVFLSRK
ncbi:HNH endonuclease [Pseudomonas viridiflava]|uniref:HNH endonuclease n=1 Tax=Pseudomonas viridiflava TaxID=33069 RepID=UPI000F046D95|nr:HNH endonuclease signature motif containing protein [Pseudomonas viridiflava]